MSATNGGGPAFPYANFYSGMSLRDYFAAKAMHAALCTASGHATEQSVVEDAAKVAYMAADAMLKAREVKP